MEQIDSRGWCTQLSNRAAPRKSRHSLRKMCLSLKKMFKRNLTVKIMFRLIAVKNRRFNTRWI